MHISEFSGDVKEEAHGSLDPSRTFGIHSCVFFLSVAFEFAAALGYSEAGDETIVIQIAAAGLEGRMLATPRRLLTKNQTNAKTFSDPRNIAREELSAQVRNLPLDVASLLFQRFGWNPEERQLREIQAKLIR